MPWVRKFDPYRARTHVHRCQSFRFLRAPFSSFSQYVVSDGRSNSTKAFQVGDVAALGAATERVQTSSSGENHVSTERHIS